MRQSEQCTCARSLWVHFVRPTLCEQCVGMSCQGFSEGSCMHVLPLVRMFTQVPAGLPKEWKLYGF